MASPAIGPALDPELEHVLSMIRHHALSNKIPADSIRLIFEAGMAAAAVFGLDRSPVPGGQKVGVPKPSAATNQRAA